MARLLRLVPKQCQFAGCTKQVVIQHRFSGACLFIRIVCESSHTTEWASSPGHCNATGSRIPAINLLFASSLLSSGNNMAKIGLMAKFLGMTIISSATFFRYQRLYLCPGIERFWEHDQAKRTTALRATPLVLSGIH